MMRKIGWRRHEGKAYHAAGHAVAAFALGLSVQFVSLHLVDNLAVGAARVERVILSAADNPDAQVAALRVDMVVMLAGPAARTKLRPLKRDECDDDFKLAQAWSTWAAFIASGASRVDIAEFGPDGLIKLTEVQQTFADQLLKQCKDRAHQIVEERWADIVKVAEALLDRAVLNADDLDALLGNRRDHTLQLLLGRKPL